MILDIDTYTVLLLNTEDTKTSLIRKKKTQVPICAFFLLLIFLYFATTFDLFGLDERDLD